MIVYGVCVGSDERYGRVAGASLEAIDAVTVERRHQSSIFTAYNSILDEIRSMEGVSAAVLLHEDVEVAPSLPGQVLRAVGRSGVAVAGAVGARHPASVAWWESSELHGHIVHEGGELLDWSHGCHDVHTVDGLLLVLSPWAIRHLRFDEDTYTGFHAYDADICFAALDAGKRVIVDDFEVFHRNRPVLARHGDHVRFARADLRWRRKWRDHPAYAGRRWDTAWGLWHLLDASTPLRSPLIRAWNKLRSQLAR